MKEAKKIKDDITALKKSKKVEQDQQQAAPFDPYFDIDDKKDLSISSNKELIELLIWDQNHMKNNNEKMKMEDV